MTQLGSEHVFPVQNAAGYNQSPPRGPGLSALLLALRERRLILALAFLVPLIFVGVTLVMPRTYASTASFMPEGRKPPSVASGLAAQLGVVVDATDASDSPAFYVELLTSREILNNVLDSVRVVDAPAKSSRLLDYYVSSERDTARQRGSALDSLRRAIVAEPARKTGLVLVRVYSRRPELAQAINQRLIYEVGRFNIERRQTRASAERRFTGARLEELRTELRVAENQLQDFLQRNRGGSSPQLEFQKDRLSREVQLRQQLFTTLAQAFEQARIDEVRDLPAVTMIEHATLPARPQSRKLVSKAFVALLAGLFIGFAIGLIKDRFSSLEDRDRNSRQELNELWHMTKSDLFGMRSIFSRRKQIPRSA
jgi:uncharacterized protein involved in exopolysaccharide biosynthesis